jgi:hypothetical protein
MSVTDKSPATQPPDQAGTTDSIPGTTSSDLDMVPPLAPGTVAYDQALSALIDHLMVVHDHQLAIHDHQVAIDAALSLVCSLVEELIP